VVANVKEKVNAMTVTGMGTQFEGSRKDALLVSKTLTWLGDVLHDPATWTIQPVEAVDIANQPVEPTDLGARSLSLQGWLARVVVGQDYPQTIYDQTAQFLMKVYLALTGEGVGTLQAINGRGWGIVTHTIDVAKYEIRSWLATTYQRPGGH
jgi:hypothetical protein